MSYLLDSTDEKTVGVVLEGLYYILDTGKKEVEPSPEGYNVYLIEMESHGIIGKIEQLQMSTNDDIHGKALQILEEFTVTEPAPLV
jgi:hypothetical protein